MAVMARQSGLPALLALLLAISGLAAAANVDVSIGEAL